MINNNFPDKRKSQLLRRLGTSHKDAALSSYPRVYVGRSVAKWLGKCDRVTGEVHFDCGNLLGDPNCRIDVLCSSLFYREPSCHEQTVRPIKQSCRQPKVLC